MKLTLTALTLTLLLCISPALAAPPATITYQGYLTGSNNAPVNAPVAMTLSLYTAPVGGTALWSEHQSTVPVINGVYSVMMGSLAPIGLPFDMVYYLGVAVGSDPEMTPRQELASVPYTFRAMGADKLNQVCDDGEILKYSTASSSWSCAVAAGQQGPQGVAGVSGTAGAAGPIGLTGPQGLPGSGSAGAAGTVGPAGVAGSQGPIGLTGVAGPQGTIGLTGTTGTTGAGGSAGSQGLAGPPGATGFQGVAGVAGPTGATGLQGATGATGTTGSIGSTGSVGATGTQGPIGLTGAAGINGTNGSTGSPGTPGTAGSNGTNGSNGAAGAAGSNGIDGLNGKTILTGIDTPVVTAAVGVIGDFYIDTANNKIYGPKTDADWTGIVGVSLVGPQGVAGIDGTNGSTGTAGTVGTPGAAGSNGTNGAAGQTGASPFALNNSDAVYTVGSVGIGVNPPAASAVLDVSSTTKGFLPPRMTTAERVLIALPATGLAMYDTDIKDFMIYNGTAWVTAGSSMPAAASGQSGYLTAADWNTFNVKAPLASPTFTGTVTAPAFSGSLTGNVAGNISGTAANVTGIVAVANGGTGATTASLARTALGLGTAATLSAGTAVNDLVQMVAGPKLPAVDGSQLTNVIGSVISDATLNTKVGSFALADNTTGYENSAFGYAALQMNTTGFSNTALGRHALSSNIIGYNNIAIGVAALGINTAASQNVAVGGGALVSQSYDGGTNYFTDNTAVGYQSLLSNNPTSTINGMNNTALGSTSLWNNTTGSSNIGIGTGAGYLLTTGDYNIDIGNSGVAAEANTIRIGTLTRQSKAFIQGISGVTPGGATQTVLVDANGQLGSVVGSTVTVDLTNNQTIAGTKTFSNTISGNISGTATNVTGTVAVANGGTGAADAATAKTNLGLHDVATSGDYNNLINRPVIATVATTGKYADLIIPKAPVMNSGQVITYTEGDDGNWKTGVTVASTRFTDNTNGTVTDNLTGLIWLKNADCLAATSSWANALTWSNSLATGSCGLSDGSAAGAWRLPNRNEMRSLVDYSKVNPALSAGHPFTTVQPDWYWSSTTYANGTGYAWYVSMGDGYVDFGSKTGNVYVWPVRGGQ